MQLLFSQDDYWTLHRALADSVAADLERARLYRDMSLGPHVDLAEAFELQAADTRRVMKDLQDQRFLPA